MLLLRWHWSCYTSSNSNSVSYLHHLSPKYHAFITRLYIPSQVGEALKKQKWKATMWKEVQALKKNWVLEIVNHPKGKHAVGCEWALMQSGFLIEISMWPKPAWCGLSIARRSITVVKAFNESQTVDTLLRLFNIYKIVWGSSGLNTMVFSNLYLNLSLIYKDMKSSG